MKRTNRRAVAVRTMAMAAVAAMAIGVHGTVAAGETLVSQGQFAAFATSSDPGFTGQATMIRTADGKTIVSVSVRGLLPDTTYGSHVHAFACADNFAGGHYKHDLAGPASPPNEIWPAFTTNASGVGNGKATAPWVARPEARSVVIHAPGGAKIACADLG
jgi:Cu-Zn family superoxide dismutase